MHSLRHYVNNVLIHAQGVHEATRFDLLGHVDAASAGRAASNVNVTTYRDDVPMAVRRAAIKLLPRLF